MLFNRIEIEDENRLLEDEIYDLGDLPILEVDDPSPAMGQFPAHPGNHDECEVFMEAYPDFTLAEAYETSCQILIGGRPVKFTGNHTGSGFNYGSTNVLEGCPSRILILAQND